jgi:tetratricopeptide (TPR) repeat protein
MDLADYYLYSRNMQGPSENGLRMDTLDIAQRYTMLALSIESGLAELWCYLGDIAMAREDYKNAERHFKTAMNCRYGVSGVMQKQAYYEAIPASRMMFICKAQERHEEALFHSRVARDYFGDSAAVHRLRADILADLSSREYASGYARKDAREDAQPGAGAGAGTGGGTGAGEYAEIRVSDGKGVADAQ